MSPRRSVVETRQTRAAIITHAVRLAATTGLEGLTIGRLATEVGLSKSGVLGHFPTKEALQLATVEAAAETFWKQVWAAVPAQPGGLRRLRAVYTRWIGLAEQDGLEAGRLLALAAFDLAERDGPVREAVLLLNTLFRNELRMLLYQAVSAGELPAGTDLDQLVFELNGVMLGLHHGGRLHRDPRAAGRACRAVGRLLDRPPVREETETGAGVFPQG